jgi:uncharacterized protein (TIGR02646 family)
MISLNKQQEPDVLVEKASEWTNDLLAYISSGQQVPSNIKNKYRNPEIKETLIKETSSKCAYCESKITHIDHGDIEHIIPKSVHPDKTFYWDNLTISCKKCNQNKSSYYNESLLLLNPYIDNPEDKIIFMGAIPFAAHGCQRTYFTIKKLKLERPELIERRSDLINKIHPLIWQYETTENETLRQLILQDLLELTEPDKEYSLMVKQLLDKLAITA